jgi:hypothetical protein
MRALEIVDELVGCAGRGAGTDAERRAATRLAAELRSGGRLAELEPFWCRPNWALAASWNVALGIAGSLLSVGHPRLGAALILVALLSVLADAVFGISPGRRLTPERASQNVVSEPPRPAPEPLVRLIITANLDAGRVGLAYRDASRRRLARMRNLGGRAAPGWLGWTALGLVWVLISALLRNAGNRGAVVSVVQLIPTVGLVLCLALLLELASSAWGPSAGDNASGVAVAVALARALDTGPPAHAEVRLVLTGAGDGDGTGLRRYLRAHRGEHRPTNTVVLGIGPCGAGRPGWLRSDGPLVPLGFFSGLCALCREAAKFDPRLRFREHAGRGCSPAFPARRAGLPAITIGSFDEAGFVPRSHQPADTPEQMEPFALDVALEAALLLVDGIDGYLAGTRPEDDAGVSASRSGPP